MFLNQFGTNTFQVSQFEEIQKEYIFDSFDILELSQGGYSLGASVKSRTSCVSDNIHIYLVTQKNLVRVFKTIDSAFKLLKPLCYETLGEDKPFKNMASMNIRIKMKGGIYD